MTFGKSFDCLKDGIPHPWIEILWRLMRSIAYHAALGHFPKPIYNMIISTLQYFLLEDLKKSQDMIKRRVASRLEQGTSRKDFVSPVLEFVSRRKGTSK